SWVLIFLKLRPSLSPNASVTRHANFSVAASTRCEACSARPAPASGRTAAASACCAAVSACCNAALACYAIGGRAEPRGWWALQPAASAKPITPAPTIHFIFSPLCIGLLATIGQWLEGGQGKRPTWHIKSAAKELLSKGRGI